jgi:hypothetical protein
MMTPVADDAVTLDPEVTDARGVPVARLRAVIGRAPLFNT